jgi:Family of unknown function (DUF6314)
MTRIAHIFQSFEGHWAFDRLIPDQGTVDGSARFQKRESDSNTLDYREDGVFHTAEGKTLKVYREYIYRLENEKISVFFAETPERLMHTLEFKYPTLESATAIHKCDCDTYSAIYKFNFPDIFSISYSVNGPKKEYSINTTFQRSKN